MPEPEGPKVVMRGPAEGDSIILPMGGQRAHITRKAARTETGGHWAIGEASQDPGFDNPPHTHDEAEAFYVLEGTYTFYTDTAPAEGVGPGTFVFIPPGAVHGFRTGPEGGRLLCIWAVDSRNRVLRWTSAEPGRPVVMRGAVVCRRIYALTLAWRLMLVQSGRHGVADKKGSDH
jgi:quercetin dioxygenase-like cupin family protein